MSSKLENACLTTCEIQPTGTTSCVVVNGSCSDKITCMIASNFNAGYLKKPTCTKITNNSDNTITTLAVASGKTPDLPVCCVKQGSKNLQFCIGSDGKFCVLSSYYLGYFEGDNLYNDGDNSYVLLTNDGYIPVGTEKGSDTTWLGTIMDPFYNYSSRYSALRMSTFSPTTADCSCIGKDNYLSFTMTARNNPTSNNIKDIIIFDKKDTNLKITLCYSYEIEVSNCGRKICYKYCYCPSEISFAEDNQRQKVKLCVVNPEDSSTLGTTFITDSTVASTSCVYACRVSKNLITLQTIYLCKSFYGSIGSNSNNKDAYYNCTLTLKPKINLSLHYNKLDESTRYSYNCNEITLASVKINCKYTYGASGASGKESKTYTGKGSVQVSLT